MDDRDYLTPAELDFRRDPSVTALGGDRYVVATDGPSEGAESTATAGRSASERTDTPSRDENRDARLDTDGGVEIADGAPFENRATAGPASPPHAEVEAEEAAADAPDAAYFVDVAVRTDEGTYDTRFEGDDIGEVCASMLRWYAGRISPADDPNDVFSVLLSRSDLSL